MKIRLVKPDYQKIAEQALAGEVEALSDLEAIAATIKLAKERGIDLVFFRAEDNGSGEISTETMQDAIDMDIELRG
jgi:EAL domain-containing protein (putative c-di-GMP-specific phosphodiesterase class I)